MIDPKAFDILPDLLESLIDAVVVDKEGRIVFFGENFAKDTNSLSANVMGKKVEDVIKGTHVHNVLKSGEEENGQIFMGMVTSDVAIDGTPIIPSFRICNRTPIRKGGKPDGEIVGAFAYSFITDVDEGEKLRLRLEEYKTNDQLIRDQISEVYQAEYTYEAIKGSSSAIAHTRELIHRVAPSNLTVTITGESGTGKELVASALHELSPRKKQPFVKINCAAIPDNLMESELFGYEAGSFTGASKNGKMGKFELANHGTILLDEIGEMPIALQSKLLRVLQESEVERIGSKKPIPIDVRIICSTNRDLREMVQEGSFRADLYYRINVVEIQVPPMRERLSDLNELCTWFIQKHAADNMYHISGIDPSVYELLSSYSWPGNIRELEHAIECACVMAGSGVLRLEHFDFLKKRMQEEDKVFLKPAAENDFAESFSTLEMQKQELEKKIILETLQKHRWNISKTAEELKMARSTLYRKAKNYKIW